MNVEFKLSKIQTTSEISVAMRGSREILMVLKSESEGYDFTSFLSKVDAIKLKNALDCLIKTMKS